MASDQIAENKSDRNADQTEEESLLSYDPAKLCRGDTDGFEKSVKSDITCDGYLENIINDQESGKDDQE